MTKKSTQQVLDQRLDEFVRINGLMQESTAVQEQVFLKLIGNIGLAQLRIVLAVARREVCSMGAIAKATQLTQGSITQAIDKMEKNGLLNRVRSTTDRRVIYIELTKKGKLITDEHENHVRKVYESWLNKLTKSEQELILKVFQKLVKE